MNPERVRRVWTTYDSVTLTFDDLVSFTVYQQLPREPGPHPGLELVVALDDVGFNHVPAPYALWRRSGRDLGAAQEYQAGGTGGWALALTSLRDLYALGGSPEQAGGDFATEVRAPRDHDGSHASRSRPGVRAPASVPSPRGSRAVEETVRAVDPTSSMMQTSRRSWAICGHLPSKLRPSGPTATSTSAG